MKKGFTLVEIIISISLILIVGISTTFFIFNNKSNKKLISITKEILEAANLYANKEVDESGNIYLNEVRNGKKGIKIPLTNLVNKGYIDESLEKQVKELTNENNYYVMLLDGSDESIDYCNDGSILTLASWIDEDKNKDIYLCNSVQANNSDLINYLLNNKTIEHIEDIENTDNFYHAEQMMDNYTHDESGSITGVGCSDFSHTYVVKQNGLFGKYGTNGIAYSEAQVYYYRGNINNNYVKIYDEVFRIINFSDIYNLTLIKEEKINNDYIDTSITDIETRVTDAINKWHTNLASKDTTNQIANCSVNLLTKEDTLYAGVPSIIINKYPDNYCATPSFIATNFLSEGDSTIIKDNSNYYMILNYRENMNRAVSPFGTLGILSTTSNWQNEIRPVIYIEQSMIKSFTGNGTKENPYILNFE